MVHFVVDNWQPMLLLKVAKFTMLYSNRYNENNYWQNGCHIVKILAS